MGRSLLTALTLAALTPATSAEEPTALADSLGRVAVDMRAVAASGGSEPLAAINPAPLVLPDGSVTLKRFYKEADRIRLQPANSSRMPSGS